VDSLDDGGYRDVAGKAVNHSRRKSPGLVSVVCTAYNQETYIRDTLDSFLSQKTEFPFEIIVHDDASTDATPEILRDYAKRFPEIVKPVVQQENQYSQGGFKPIVYASEYAEGEYIAVCEADDYWLSDNKLQLQVEALEANPGLDFCFHPAICMRNGRLEEKSGWDYGADRVFGVGSILRCANGHFAPTCSYMFRRRVLESMPDWFFGSAPVGDFFLEMYGASRGGALYLASPRSVYRKNSQGSWHDRTYSDDRAFNTYLASMIDAINLMQEDFPDFHLDMQWKKSWLHTYSALHFLYPRKYEDFRRSIENSVKEYRYISRKQAILYRLKKLPGLARLLMVFFNKYRSSSS
jgi:glycosyltransferase involved in cell wall biosynthesis